MRATEEHKKGGCPNPPWCPYVVAMSSSHFPFGCRPPCVWNDLSFMYLFGTKCRESDRQDRSRQTKAKGSAGHISGTSEIAFSRFCISTPGSRKLLPTLPKQVLPHPLSVLSADVLASFKADKNRRAPFSQRSYTSSLWRKQFRPTCD